MIENIFQKCFYCNSIWVYWNWFIEESDKNDSFFIHECWDCNGSFKTLKKVKNGISNNYLKSNHPEINKIKNSIKDCHDFILYCQKKELFDIKNKTHWRNLIASHIEIKKDLINKLKAIKTSPINRNKV